MTYTHYMNGGDKISAHMHLAPRLCWAVVRDHGALGPGGGFPDLNISPGAGSSAGRGQSMAASPQVPSGRFRDEVPAVPSASLTVHLFLCPAQ